MRRGSRARSHFVAYPLPNEPVCKPAARSSHAGQALRPSAALCAQPAPNRYALSTGGRIGRRGRQTQRAVNHRAPARTTGRSARLLPRRAAQRGHRRRASGRQAAP
eukprot:scaffold274176_cov31-Tisochrysis_lutea.AAC.1